MRLTLFWNTSETYHVTVTDTSPGKEALRICSNCGAWVRRERSGCPWCGTRLSGAGATTSSHVVTEGADVTPDDEGEDLLSSSLSVQFWRRLFLAVAAVLALLFIVMGSFAVYQGLNDRAVSDARQAVDHYENGRSYYEEGRFELAAAEFREALNLKPDFEAARQALAIAEAGASGDQTGGSVEPLPTPAETRTLWNEAVEAYNAGDFDVAADKLDQIRALDPNFKTDDVNRLLFDAYVKRGISAADAGQFEAAVRAFDQGLAIEPGDADVLRRRQLASAYLRGLEAVASEEWNLATTELRRVYILDESYHDVQEKLAAAHREYGNEFFRREIWCDAAEQYRQSNQVSSDSNVVDQAQVAESRCSQRVTQLPAATATPRAVTVTDTQTITATSTPVSGDVTYVVDGSPTVDTSDTCKGHYITGRILNEEGAPVAGIFVRAVDQWGNRFEAKSKGEPTGVYDMPINSIQTTYNVYVVGLDGEPASPVLSIPHNESLASSSRACHVVDWQRVDAES